MTHASKLFALQCNAYGTPPDIQAVPLPAPQPLHGNEVRIQIQCAAFNFTDHLLIQGRYQDKPELPFIPGLDAAGTVLDIGPDVSRLQRGDVVVSSGVIGAWASELTAPSHRLVKVPEGLAPTDAVASINSHLTAYHGLTDRAGLKAGERVLILGANGAVGKACEQIARHMGAQVFTVSRLDKDYMCIRDHTQGGRVETVANNQLKEGIRTLLGRKGADIVVDPVGDQHTEAAVRNLTWRGRLLVIGFAAGNIPKISTNLLLLKGASLVGVYCGGLLVQETTVFTQQLKEMFALITNGVLSPLPHETLPADPFAPIWARFSTAPRASKVLLGFQSP